MKKIYYDDKTKQVLEKSRKDFPVRQIPQNKNTESNSCFFKKIFSFFKTS